MLSLSRVRHSLVLGTCFELGACVFCLTFVLSLQLAMQHLYSCRRLPEDVVAPFSPPPNSLPSPAAKVLVDIFDSATVHDTSSLMIRPSRVDLAAVRPFVPSAPSCWYGADKEHIQPWSPTMPLLQTGKGDFAPFCRGWDSGFKASEFLPGLWVQGPCYDQVLSLTILILGFGVQGFRNQNRVAGFKARP